MTDSPRSPGKTTIDPGVLHTIARLAALRVDGVSRLSPVPGGVNRLTRRGQEGIRIEVEDSRVDVDVYVILRAGTNVREVSRTIQNDVARAISEMVGMEVGQIGIHIEDVDYQET
ncbi:MAG: hypothetical protein Fur0022_16690 [Anaerolineales bacterium]